ncbi:MAG: hypothetical protein U0V64_03185 [Cyclobacteriaceae bacterium]
MKSRHLLVLLAWTPVALFAQERVPFEGIDSRWQNGSDRRDSRF